MIPSEEFDQIFTSRVERGYAGISRHFMPHDMKPQINSNLNNKGPKQKNDDGN